MQRSAGRIWLAGGVLLALPAGLRLVQALDDRHVNRIWQSLKRTGGPEVFTEELLAGLPAPVQRYLRHAIAPGTPLAASVELTMSGTMKLGADWQPFTARQILTPGQGFVWRARAQMGPTFFQGADHYAAGEGRMRFALFGLLPLIQATGPDTTRSALGRLMGESVLVAARLLPHCGVQWTALDEEHIQATMTVAGETTTLTLTIAAVGQLREVVLPRWNVAERDYVPFGVAFSGEHMSGGYTIPAQMQAGWWYGTERYQQEGAFFRATIETARFH
jgi:hypothetical protein